MKYKDMDTRFREKFRIEEGGKGCWIWLPKPRHDSVDGMFHGSLYGEPTHNVSPRKYAYVKYSNKPPLPSVKHRLINTCGQKRCVNPDHYEVEVMLPKPIEKEIAVIQQRRELTPELMMTIKRDPASMATLMVRYGFDAVTIHRIKKRLIVA